jgi:hypothetical protein
MAKITSTNVSSGFNNTINTNFSAIDDELNNKVLYRDNPTGEPNQMLNDFDMNSNDILNGGSAGFISLSVGGNNITSADSAVSTLPDQTSNAGKLLKTNGTTASWTEMPTFTFSSVANMQAGTTVDGTTVTLVTGARCTTGYTTWKVVTSTTNIALGGGLFAMPIDSVWADDFSTDGTTFTDVEIQAALDTADSKRGTRLGENTFIINNQVDMMTSTDDTTILQPTNSLRGMGKNKTVIINRFAGSWVVHKPSVAQASIAGNTIGARFTGFSLSFMTATTDGSSPSGAAGAEIYSAWFGQSVDYDEVALKGNGFSIPLDAALNVLPDRYSCGEFRILGFSASGGEGIGLNIETPSLTLRMHDFYIITNAMGGILLPGAAHKVTSGTLSGNGASNGVNGVDGFGLDLAHATGFTQHGCDIQGIELDNNWGVDLRIAGYKNKIHTRIIQNGTLGVGGNTFRATDMVKIDSSVSGFAALNELNLITRIDSIAGAAINVITTTDSAGTEDNNIDLKYLVTGGDDDSNVVIGNLLGTTRQRNVVSQDGHVTFASHQGAISNTNKVFIRADSSNALDIAEQKISFASSWDDFGLWSNANDQYTVPHKGLCTVRFQEHFRTLVAGNFFSITVKVNSVTAGTIINEGDGYTDGVNGTTMAGHLTIAVDKDDVLEIWGSAESNDGVFIIAVTDVGTTIFME